MKIYDKEYLQFGGSLLAVQTLQLFIFMYMGGFPGGSAGKEFACKEGDLGSIPGLGRSLAEGKATHSSILAWRLPWTVQALGSQSRTRLSDFRFPFTM